MVRKCLECKYFKDNGYNGNCILHNRYKKRSDSCEDFTCKCDEIKNDKEYEDRLDELELRIFKLERMVRNNRYLLNVMKKCKSGGSSQEREEDVAVCPECKKQHVLTQGELDYLEHHGFINIACPSCFRRTRLFRINKEDIANGRHL